MGLLDAFNSPEMGLAMGLLNAGGASSRPVSLGQGIAQGYQGFQQAQENNQQRAARDQQMQMYTLQMKQMQDAQKLSEDRKIQLVSYLKDLQATNPAEAAKYQQAVSLGIPLEKVWEQANKDPKFAYHGSGIFNESKLTPTGMPTQVGTIPQPANDGLSKLIAARDALPQGHPNRALYDAAITKETTHTPPTQTPYFQPVPTAEGVISFNSRTGQGSPLSVGGKPVIKSADNPELQGKISGAKVGADAVAKRDVNMNGVSNVISQASDILTGKNGALPTGSPIGAAVDAVGGVFGASPAGASEAQTLKALAGALTAKMPRMEGPQSDKDVQLYREMAADVGNPMIPRARRIAALEVVKKLYTKYDKSAVDIHSQADAILNGGK